MTFLKQLVMIGVVYALVFPLTALAAKREFVDHRNLIQHIEVKVDNFDKTLADITLRVYSAGKEDPNNPDPIDRLVLIKNDSAEFLVVEAQKIGPGTFLARGISGGVWEIQTDDLGGQPLDRNDVDVPHIHGEYPVAATPTVAPSPVPNSTPQDAVDR